MKKLRRRYVTKSRDLDAKCSKTCQNRLRTIAVGLKKELKHCNDFNFPSEPLTQETFHEFLAINCTWLDAPNKGTVAARNAKFANNYLEQRKAEICIYDGRVSPTRMYASDQCCPCIARARAGPLGLWLVKRNGDGQHLIRAFSLEEMFRMQGFPNGFVEKVLLTMSAKQAALAVVIQ